MPAVLGIGKVYSGSVSHLPVWWRGTSATTLPHEDPTVFYGGRAATATNAIAHYTFLLLLPTLTFLCLRLR
jgi:hypothetical protein